MEKAGLITLEYVNTVIKERPADIHKGQCGRVLIVAGTIGMAGAAVLSARGALKSGAGLVKIAAPKEIFNILQTAVPQATCMDVKDLSQGDLEIYGSIAVGPGLGVDEERYLLISNILKNYNGPVVLDADGINCICKYDKELQSLCKAQASVILTPHVGEGDRLLKALGSGTVKELGRQKAAELISEKTGAVVLMKGPGTIVTGETKANAGTSEERQTYVNTTGNPGMATGGSGDVLTGVIASFAASGAGSLDAAGAGAYIHGLAGDIAADKYGQWGMTALEIEESLPAALKQVVGK
ncbi:MAG: NAD(P)H-hydrate dehydratase [Bacillota bacterium]|nr:NAD(P)H-hydrate dehydratase [Bacillota bacterium]